MSASHNFFAADIMAANIEGIERGLKIAMIELQTELREKLSQMGTGAGYFGGAKKLGFFRTRSAAGEPPAVDTGTLRNSVQSKPQYIAGTGMTSIVLTGLVAGVDKDARIPRWLEYGTSRMKARPFIAPSLEVIRPTVANTIGDQMQRSIKRMKRRAMKAAQ
jgi:HK97 gp10 family phage protein